MAKVIIEFDTSEDARDLTLAIKAQDIVCVIQSLDNWMRSKIKHSDENTDNLEEARAILLNGMNDIGVDIWD